MLQVGGVLSKSLKFLKVPAKTPANISTQVILSSCREKYGNCCNGFEERFGWSIENVQKGLSPYHAKKVPTSAKG
jgi:hypothetical protein